jgi:hypothetical protein
VGQVRPACRDERTRLGPAGAAVAVVVAMPGGGRRWALVVAGACSEGGRDCAGGRRGPYVPGRCYLEVASGVHAASRPVRKIKALGP